MKDPVIVANDLIRDGVSVKDYEKLQQTRKHRLEFFKKKGISVLVCMEQDLYEWGQKVLSVMKLKSITRSWMEAYYELLSELGEKEFEKLMPDLAAEIVACQYAKIDPKSEPISYASAGALLLTMTDRMDTEQIQLYQKNVKAAIAWGIINGVHK